MMAKAEDDSEVKSIFDFIVKDIDGNDVSLEKYRGHVCVIVNVASK
jgi:glutathione peroxidase-family protein